MATTYPTPSDISFSDSSGYLYGRSEFLIADDTTADMLPLHVCFYVDSRTSYTNFQVEYRKCVRYKPSYVVANELESEWSAWSAWTAHNDRSSSVNPATWKKFGDTDMPCPDACYEVNAAFSEFSDLGNTAYADLYTNGNIDQIAYQFRVRYYASSSKYGSWGQYLAMETKAKTLFFKFVPIISMTAIPTDSGLRVTCTSDWERDLTLKLSRPYFIYSGAKYVRKSNTFETTVAYGSNTIDLPGEYYMQRAIIGGAVRDVGNTAGFASVSLVGDIDYCREFWIAQSYLKSPFCTLVLDGQYLAALQIPVTQGSYTVSAPTVTITPSSEAIDVKIVVASTALTPMVEVSFTDADGNIVRLDPVLEPSTTRTYVATIDAPPYDVPVHFIVKTFNASNGYRIDEQDDIVIPSDGRFSFTSGGDNVHLRFNLVPSMSYSKNMETVECAGRDKPVSRYGEGGRRSMSLQGAILPDSEVWKPEIEWLNRCRDVVLRAPNGLYYRVAVESAQMDEPLGWYGKAANVSISMVEVG